MVGELPLVLSFIHSRLGGGLGCLSSNREYRDGSCWLRSAWTSRGASKVPAPLSGRDALGVCGEYDPTATGSSFRRGAPCVSRQRGMSDGPMWWYRSRGGRGTSEWIAGPVAELDLGTSPAPIRKRALPSPSGRQTD
jgi:hypothetical protein